MNQSKAKFIDRFRTQIIKPTPISPGQKSQRQIQASLSSQLRSFNAQQQPIQQQKIQSSIIDKLQKHIQYLQKKLKDAQKQIQNIGNSLQQCLRRLAERDVELSDTLEKMEQQKKKIVQLQDGNQFIKNEYQSFMLRTKMEKLSGEVTNRKEFIEKLELKNSRKKKGRFSSAFLPGSFNGQSKYTQRKAEHFQAIIQQYQVKNIQQTAFINISNLTQSLTTQYRKLQQDYNKCQLELSTKTITIRQLHQKILTLQTDLQKLSKKQPEVINNQKCEQQTQSQNIKIQVEYHQHASPFLQKELALSKEENKRLLDKIKQSEERMVQISDAIKETTDIELNNMFAASISEIDILQVKNSDRLNIFNSVVDFKVSGSQKMQKQIQTDRIQVPQSLQIQAEEIPFKSVQLQNSPISQGSASNNNNSQNEQTQMFKKLQGQIERYFQRRESKDIKTQAFINNKQAIDNPQPKPFEISAQHLPSQQQN